MLPERGEVRQFNAKITVNESVSSSWKLLGFEWPAALEPPVPGQFFTVRPFLSEPGDAGLLRRPLAFAAWDGEAAYSLYQIRGKGTKALALMEIGRDLDVMAPLGRGFPMPEPGERPVFLGGGIGIGPVLFLASRLSVGAAGGDPAGHRAGTGLWLGFRTAEAIPRVPSGGGRIPRGEAVIGAMLAGSSFATDDGSAGFGGNVVQAFLNDPSTRESGETPIHVYACGPLPMLKAVAGLAKAGAFSAHISAEQWMACGVGACHGCVLPAASGGYLRVCADGPVFPSGDIDWEKCR